MATRIAIADIVKTFKTPGGGTTRALDAVSLEIEPGELFFLLGPSGCGKTTLLRAIAGFVDPDAGSISFTRDGDTREVTHLPANKRNTAMVFQSYALWPHMTVADNVAFGLKVQKVPPADREARVNEALAAVQMQEYAARKPTQLSGGQQQRVALARALVVRPDVLLLDEPLSNLDAKLRIELRAEIRRIVKDAGLTAVYVTHDQKEALSMADRIAVMRDGHIEQLGPPTSLYHEPATTFVGAFLGETNTIRDIAVTPHDSTLEIKLLGQTVHKTPSKVQTVELRQPLAALIRPESIILTTPDDDRAISAEVRTTTFLGEHTQHRVATEDGTELLVTTSEATPRNPGDRVGLRIDPDRFALVADEP